MASSTRSRPGRSWREYPSLPGERIETDEVNAAIATTRTLLSAAEKLVVHLGIFT